MPTRNIGRDCQLTIYFWSGTAWEAGISLANPTAAIEGNARRVTFESSVDTIDVSGISDAERWLLPGRTSARLSIEKLVSSDIIARRQSGQLYYFRTGERCKVAVSASGTVTWIFIGVISGINWQAEDGPQIERIDIECSYYGAVA